MKIFIDTSAFISYFLKQDSLHSSIVKCYTAYQKQKAIFVTSDYILDELFTWFTSHQSQEGTNRVIQAINKIIDQRGVEVIFIDKEIFEKTQKIFLKFSDHKISFTDATTYVLYKEYKLDEIFTLDSDFQKMRLRTSLH